MFPKASNVSIVEVSSAMRSRDKTTVNIPNLVMRGISSGKKLPVSKPRKGGRNPLGKEKSLLGVTRDLIAEDTSTMETFLLSPVKE
jgi:hypothetical protein